LKIVEAVIREFLLQVTHRLNFSYYAALLPRSGPHYASHCVCLSVRPVVVAVGHVFAAPLASQMYFSARTEGRI